MEWSDGKELHHDCALYAELIGLKENLFKGVIMTQIKNNLKVLPQNFY